MNFCEFLYINFYGYYKNFIITLILTWFLKKSPIINSALTKLLSLTRLEPSQQQQQQVANGTKVENQFSNNCSYLKLVKNQVINSQYYVHRVWPRKIYHKSTNFCKNYVFSPNLSFNQISPKRLRPKYFDQSKQRTQIKRKS